MELISDLKKPHLQPEAKRNLRKYNKQVSNEVITMGIKVQRGYSSLKGKLKIQL